MRFPASSYILAARPTSRLPFSLFFYSKLGVDVLDNKLLAIILAVLLPPLAVFLKLGAGKDLVINVVLCIFFWVPGVIHALWLVNQ